MPPSSNDAFQLFRAGAFSEAIDCCERALENRPDNVELRILMARACMARNQDARVRHELREVLRLEPDNLHAYRLLGELALRNDQHHSAEMFLREALRIAPHDLPSRDLLKVVLSLIQPTAAVEKFPAATAADGCPSSSGSMTIPITVAAATPSETTQMPIAGARKRSLEEARRSAAQAASQIGFGSYLRSIGLLSDEQLDQVLDHQIDSGQRIGEAARELGFISEPKLQWAALAYHSRNK